MDQENGAGHHAITHAAVAELFASLPEDAHGLINGMTKDQYYLVLDHAQEHQDRWYGPTTHPAWADGEAQREHGMADPHLTGEQNLAIDRNYVEQNLADARHGNEMIHLGAAVHALEDSFSEAHAWRGDAVNRGDPSAPIESLNVFNPLPSPHQHTWGWPFGTEGTHDARFDHVPVGKNGDLIRGTDIAAAHAIAQALGAYHDHQHENDTSARKAIDATIDQFYKASESSVKVNDVYTDSWAHERDHRLEIHHHEIIEYQSHADLAHGADSHHSYHHPGHHESEQPASSHDTYHDELISAVSRTDGGVATDATLPGGVTNSSADEVISAGSPFGGPPNSPPDPSVLAGDRDAGHLDAPSVGPANYPDASPADQHLPETSHDSGHDRSAASYDPAYDRSAAASYDPSAVGHDGPGHDGPGHDGAGHDGAGHDGAGHDGAGHDGAGHDDPAYDDPAYDASAAASYEPSAVGHDGPEHDRAGHDDPAYDASAAASYDPSAVGHDGAGHDLSSYDPSRDAVSGHVPGHVGPGHDAAGHEGPGHDLSSYDPSRDAVSGHFPGHDGSGYDPGYDGAGYDPGYDGAGYDPGYGTDYVAGGVGDGQFGAPPASTPQDLDLHRGAHARNVDMLLAWHWFTTAPYDPSHDGSGVAGGDNATASHNAGHDGSGVPDDHSAMASHDVSHDGSGFDATGADGSGA
jgi:hypothetical protein